MWRGERWKISPDVVDSSLAGPRLLTGSRWEDIALCRAHRVFAPVATRSTSVKPLLKIGPTCVRASATVAYMVMKIERNYRPVVRKGNLDFNVWNCVLQYCTL